VAATTTGIDVPDPRGDERHLLARTQSKRQRIREELAGPAWGARVFRAPTAGLSDSDEIAAVVKRCLGCEVGLQTGLTESVCRCTGLR